jgi:hypothetical protein
MDVYAKIYVDMDLLVKNMLKEHLVKSHIRSIVKNLVNKNIKKDSIEKTLCLFHEKDNLLLLSSFLDKVICYLSNDISYLERYSIFLTEIGLFINKKKDRIHPSLFNELNDKVNSQLYDISSSSDFIKIIALFFVVNVDKFTLCKLNSSRKIVDRYYFHVLNLLSQNIHNRYRGPGVSAYIVGIVFNSLKFDLITDRDLERLFYDHLTSGNKKFSLLLEELTIKVKKSNNIVMIKRYDNIMTQVFLRIIVVNKNKYFEIILRQTVLLSPGVSIDFFAMINDIVIEDYKISLLVKKVNNMDQENFNDKLLLITKCLNPKRGPTLSLKISPQEVSHLDIFKIFCKKNII